MSETPREAAPMAERAENSAEPIEIPYAELSGQALRGVLESFVLREGTDYGTQVYSLEQKVEHVLAQLRDGRARIVFDPSSETVGIVTDTRRRPA